MALLEPVVDGPGYVAYLRELHSSYLERFFPGRVPESDDQACGYAFTDEFASELCALDLGALTGPPAAELMCLSSPGLTSGPALAAVLEQLGSEVVLKELVTDEFWRREVGINLAAVPRLVLDDILDFMRSGS